MIKWILRRAARAFGKSYQYDVDYMLDVIDASSGAGLRLSAFPLISQYRGPKQAHPIWVGAIFASTLEGDCGPCAQLVIDMAIESGADAALLRQCHEGMAEDAGEVGLGFRFAIAAIRGDMEVDQLKEQIEVKYGKRAVIAAAFAAATGRFYPVFKRGLGYGHACTRLEFQTPPALELAAS